MPAFSFGDVEQHRPLVSAIQAIQQRPPEIIMKLLFIGTGAVHGLGYQETCKLNPLEQGQADRPEAAP